MLVKAVKPVSGLNFTTPIHRYSDDGFLSQWGTSSYLNLSYMFFCFSMKYAIQLLGYPQDYGNPRMLPIAGH